MTKRKELTITVERFVGQVAWCEWQGQHREAAALRELAKWFDPPYRINEADVQARIAELQRHASKPPLLD